jgi:(p)ppGpp synthase/HD superfamily hydrolase
MLEQEQLKNSSYYYNKAMMIATDAHANQKRKNGELYINHCIRVSEMVSWMYGDTIENQIIALLHDTIEDTTITLNYLENEGFSQYILIGVDTLTHKKEDSYLTYILKIKNYKQYINIKLCDIRDNLNGSTGTLKDKYLLAKYILEN